MGMSPPMGGNQQVPLDTGQMITMIGNRVSNKCSPLQTQQVSGIVYWVYWSDWCLYWVCYFRYQQVLDKYCNDWMQWEEKAREELTEQHIQTGVNPATQLTRASTPASLKKGKEVKHALDAFYVEMILWKLGIGKEAKVLGYTCLKFIEMLRRKCLSKLIINTFGNRVSHQGPWGEGILFPLLVALWDSSTDSALKLASDVLYNQWPLRLVIVKRDEEEELMMTICNQVMANTPVHKEQLSQARYIAARTFGYGAQERKLERHDDQFQQMMVPFCAASIGRVQNRCSVDVKDKTQNPLGRKENSNHHVILTEEQQLDSTTQPDVRPKEIAITIPVSTPGVMEPILQKLPVLRAMQAFLWWVNKMML